MCHSCAAVYVKTGSFSGIVHEKGCPDSWKNIPTDCLWCGNEFIPETKHQKTCSPECNEAYYF